MTRPVFYLVVLVLMAALAAALLNGCGNVSLRGEGLTAAETSAIHAYEAACRAEAEPSWQRVYLLENFKQWRSFVRSARNDPSWGPVLEGEE